MFKWTFVRFSMIQENLFMYILCSITWQEGVRGGGLGREGELAAEKKRKSIVPLVGEEILNSLELMCKPLKCFQIEHIFDNQKIKLLNSLAR